MKVEYTNRAVADLRQISSETRAAFGDEVTAQIEARFVS
jgi:hypothetical protein